MKRKPVGRRPEGSAKYPAMRDPEFWTLAKRIAAATASIGAAGVIGLAVPSCSSSAAKDTVEQQDTYDSYGGEIGPDSSEVVGVQDGVATDADSGGDWVLLT